MKAIQQRQFGGPEVLEFVEVERPNPIWTEVLVRVKAVGLNPVDKGTRMGGFPWDQRLPRIPGWDISGVIEEVTPGSNRFAVGDEVYGMPFFPRPASAYAEFVAAPAKQLARKPRTLDHVHAAALPLAGLTAWQSLVEVARVQPGQRVLIHAGGGGVGHLAVQIAKGLGAWVAATASVTKHDFVYGLGADLVIDYQKEDFANAVSDMDVVLESVRGDYPERSLKVLRPGGLLLSIVQLGDADLTERAQAAGRRFASVLVEPDGAALETLADWVDAGRLKVHVSETFALQNAAQAHEHLTGNVMGKLVLVV